jgi:hypothetical protein
MKAAGDTSPQVYANMLGRPNPATGALPQVPPGWTLNQQGSQWGYSANGGSQGFIPATQLGGLEAPSLGMTSASKGPVGMSGQPIFGPPQQQPPSLGFGEAPQFGQNKQTKTLNRFQQYGPFAAQQ